MIKKIVVLIIVIIVPLMVSSSLVGDVNSDGNVTSVDYITIRKHILGTSILTGNYLKNADLNLDGKVTSADYIMVKKTITNNLKIDSNINYADVSFVNVYDTPEILKVDSNGYKFGQSIIIKTKNNKYILIDTGISNAGTVTGIYKQLKKYQNKDQVTIDYMIITHGHHDHHGNALSILGNNNIDVKKIIMKHESKNADGLKKYNQLTSKYKDKMVNITGDGQKIVVDNNTEFYLFNTADVYKDKKCHEGYVVSFIGNGSATAKKINGKYYYFDGSTYPNIKLVATDKVVYKHGEYIGSKGMDNYFYATPSNKTNDCNANNNSLVIVVKIKGLNDNSYMYFSGDINNGGYDIVPSNGIYGNVDGMLYSSIESIKYSSETGWFTGAMADRLLTPSETNVANAVKKFLGNEVNNIKIYQMAHHGANDSPDVVKILNLNRENLNAVMTYSTNMCTSSSFPFVRSCYILSKAKILFPGGKTKNGIRCTINYAGKTNCGEY